MNDSVEAVPSKNGRNTGICGGRLGRTIVSLVVMILFGTVLAVLNVFTARHDLALATGPKSEAQRKWFVEAADRPDLATFFKKLPHADRVAMAKAVGRYDDASLAKLCGILLADFDADARAALTEALKRVAAAHPEAVAEQLKQKGSFQTLGVSEALRTQGERVLPGVVNMLSNADARPAAVAYLVRTGEAAVPVLLPKLDDANKDVRLAAADALGQLRARDAVDPLLKKFQTAPVDERPAYLAALAAVGDPSTEDLMAATLDDPTKPLAERTPAALGLGRIGGGRAARLLWKYAPSDEPAIANAALAALGSVGPPALAVPGVPPLLRIDVATVIEGPEADAALRAALSDPATRLAAVEAAKGRSGLLTDLARLLPVARNDGDLAAALVSSLSTSDAGRARLTAYQDDPSLGGFIRRAAG